MLELLSPAGSPEAVTAAVQSGADAVYLGYGDFNARRNAKNFSEEEFAAAVSYCHLRGAKVYLTLNTLVTDRELPAAAQVAAVSAEESKTPVIFAAISYPETVELTGMDYVTGTNLTYRMPELLTRDWYVDVDVSKYAAYFVVALNHDMSVSSIIDPLKKIENLLASRK